MTGDRLRPRYVQLANVLRTQIRQPGDETTVRPPTWEGRP
jgi:hypothetical protein